MESYNVDVWLGCHPGITLRRLTQRDAGPSDATVWSPTTEQHKDDASDSDSGNSYQILRALDRGNPDPFYPTSAATTLRSRTYQRSLQSRHLIALALRNSPMGSLRGQDILNFINHHLRLFPHCRNYHNLKGTLYSSKWFTRNGDQWLVNPENAQQLDEQLQKRCQEFKLFMDRPDDLRHILNGESTIHIGGTIETDRSGSLYLRSTQLIISALQLSSTGCLSLEEIRSYVSMNHPEYTEVYPNWKVNVTTTLHNNKNFQKCGMCQTNSQWTMCNDLNPGDQQQLADLVEMITEALVEGGSVCKEEILNFIANNYCEYTTTHADWKGRVAYALTHWNLEERLVYEKNVVNNRDGQESLVDERKAEMDQMDFNGFEMGIQQFHTVSIEPDSSSLPAFEHITPQIKNDPLASPDDLQTDLCKNLEIEFPIPDANNNGGDFLMLHNLKGERYGPIKWQYPGNDQPLDFSKKSAKESNRFDGSVIKITGRVKKEFNAVYEDISDEEAATITPLSGEDQQAFEMRTIYNSNWNHQFPN